ncbi:MAG: GMC family oxidoreductase [Thermomicrobiales bacterium]|nr:GMC family oxidoreductase [Thermomicrobiales bacterium]
MATPIASPVATPEASFDAIVVGGGASGCLMAAKLAQAGKKVVILEAGPPVTTADLWSSLIWGRRIHGSPLPPLTGGSEPISINLNLAWGTGGSAAHHFACWFRLHKDDFSYKSTYGIGLDWPITYNDLRPYYDRIQDEVGISGDQASDIWTPPHDPYPMPALPVLDQGKAVKRGFDALKIPTSPMPQAILSQPKGERAACILDGWCGAGCPIGALANPQVTYLREALLAGATFINNAYVTRVLTNPAGDRATGVEFFDAAGARQEISGKVVALGAYVLDNPRILLNSASSAHPHGLANSSGLVGAYMMTHIGGQVFGLFKEDTKPYMGRTGGELWSQADYTSDEKTNGYIGGYQWLCATAAKPNDLLGICMMRPELFGKPLDDFLQTASHHLATITALGNDLPDEANRLTLSDQKDQFGFPLAQTTHSIGPNQTKMREAALKQGQEIMKAAGADDIWINPRANQHILGGVIMGSDPKASVTDGFGQTHDVPNLVVLGSSVFPTSGAVNPTYSIHAITLRTAEHVVNDWDAIA